MSLEGLLGKIQNSWREEDHASAKDDKDGGDNDKSKLPDGPDGKSKSDDKDDKLTGKDHEEKEESDDEPDHWSLARSQGWMPEEEWKEAGRDAEEWKPAKAFLKDGEVRNDLRKMKRALKREQKRTDALLKERDVIHKSSYEAGRQSILSRRDKAIKDENLEEVVRTGDELAELEKQAAASKDLKTEGEKKEYEISNEEKLLLKQWGVENQWYINDSELQQFVHQVASQYMEENDESTVIEAFEYAGTQARAAYPQRVRGAKKSSAVIEKQPNRRGTSIKGADRAPRPHELPEELRDLYKNFSAAGMFKTEKNPKGKLVYEDWVKTAMAKD
jgi:hypothetical protein